LHFPFEETTERLDKEYMYSATALPLAKNLRNTRNLSRAVHIVINASYWPNLYMLPQKASPYCKRHPTVFALCRYCTQSRFIVEYVSRSSFTGVIPNDVVTLFQCSSF
jgi:hypothetical protein